MAVGMLSWSDYSPLIHRAFYRSLLLAWDTHGRYREKNLGKFHGSILEIGVMGKTLAQPQLEINLDESR
jgi:hypothetical protein